MNDEAERERARREAEERFRIEKAQRDAETQRRRLEEAERSRKDRDADDPFRTEQRTRDDD